MRYQYGNGKNEKVLRVEWMRKPRDILEKLVRVRLRDYLDDHRAIDQLRRRWN